MITTDKREAEKNFKVSVSYKKFKQLSYNLYKARTEREDLLSFNLYCSKHKDTLKIAYNNLLETLTKEAKKNSQI